jgi:hypothetical protein
LVDQWLEARQEQDRQRRTQIDELRTAATLKAAALHALSNWLVIGLLIWWLVLTSY